MLTGKVLIDDIDNWSGPSGSLAFWSLGQASFIVKLGRQVIYFDPYLSPHPKRLIPPLLTPDQVNNADLVLCSHDHEDHIDTGSLPCIADASPNAVIVVPKAVQNYVTELGISAERIVGLNDGQAWENESMTVMAVKAKHEFFDVTAEGNYPYLGYIVRSGDTCVYHSGDTLVYDGLAETLRQFRPQVVFVPINGRDAKRYSAGCIGNMTYQEAVDLVGEVHPELAVPMHYNMFEGNTEDPQLFADYLHVKYPTVKSWIGSVGERVELFFNKEKEK
jgi:L-ascorbate 6-phosphate lactonase